jgi:Ca2+-binding RTX toxin-like protein
MATVESVIVAIANWDRPAGSGTGPLNEVHLRELALFIKAQIDTLSIVPTGRAPNATFIAYNGNIGEHQAWELARNASGQSEGGKFYISDTDAGKLLNEDAFRVAVQEAAGSFSLGNALIDGPKQNGVRTSQYGVSDVLAFNDQVSLKIAENASGNVLVFTKSIGADGVFAMTELPALVANASVTSINGIPREQFVIAQQTLPPAEALTYMHAMVETGAIMQGSGVRIVVNGQFRTVGELILDAYKSEGADGSSAMRSRFTAAAEAFTHNAPHAVHAYGVVADAIGLLAAVFEAAEKANDGEYIEAGIVLEEFSARYAGSFAAGWAGGALASGIRFVFTNGIKLTPGRAAMWTIATITSALAAGAAADSAIAELFEMPEWNLDANVARASKDTAAGLAFRYALSQMDPFAELFMPQSAQAAMALYDPVTGTGSITREWIETRCLLMAAFLEYRASGDDDHVVDQFLGTPFPLARNTVISDAALGAEGELTIDGKDFFFADDIFLRFGDDNANVLSGGELDDRLFGGGGDDTLTGGKDGSNPGVFDYLEGGEGNDTYNYRSGDGQDVIFDVWGTNQINFAGTSIAGSFQRATDPANPTKHAWSAEDDSGILFTLLDGNLERGTLLISGSDLGPQGQITIRDFANGRFGLNLATGNSIKSLELSPTLVEGMAGTVALTLNGTDNLGQAVRLSVGGINSHRFSLLFDGEPVPFNSNGDLDLYLAPGRTHYVFTLLARHDFTVDTPVNFIATLLNALDQPILATQTIRPIDVTATDEADPATPENFDVTYANEGDIEFATDTGQSVLVLDDDRSSTVYGRPSVTGGPVNAEVVVNAGGGADYISIQAGSVVANGGSGNDFIWAQGPANSVRGDAGADVVTVGLVTDQRDRSGDQLFGEGEVTLDQAIAVGEEPSQEITGDLLVSFAQQANDLLVGSHARDLLAGGGGSDTLVAGAGSDLIFGDKWVSLIVPASVNWPTFQWSWSLVSTVGAGGVTTYSYDLTSYIEDRFGTGFGGVLSSGDATAGSADTIYAGAGDDMVMAGAGADSIDAGSGNDVVFGEAGADFVLGGAGQDILIGDGAGDSGNDYIDGGADNDRIDGMAGSDYLLGGGGDDVINADTAEAGAGDDYVDAGDGNDQVWGGAGSDSLFGGMGNDLLLGDSTTTTNAAAGNDSLNGGDGNDRLMGFGGSDVLFGGAGDDELLGHAPGSAADDKASDYLDGGADNDTLFGWGGDDKLIGGDGNDQLVGDEATLAASLHGDDSLDGGAGEDVLFGLGGADLLLGGADDDALYGGDGNDVLAGGAGQDFMRGEAGDDIYVFDEGDCLVVNGVADGIDDSQGLTRLVFNGGLSYDDVQVNLGVSFNSINLSSSDGSTGVVIKNALGGGLYGVHFADGVYMSAAQLIGTKLASATNQTSNANDTHLYGGMAADQIVSNGTNVTISGGGGNDTLRSMSVGNTTYLFNRGDGHDNVNDHSYFAATNGQVINTLKLGEGIEADDIVVDFTVGQPSARLTFGAGDAVTMANVTFSDPLNGYRTFDLISFEDGSTLSWQQLLEQRSLRITNLGASTNYSGTQLNDDIFGSSASEIINGAMGDDRLDGGAGNDVLTGGAGSDTYVFRRGSGSDQINNFDLSAGKLDTLEIAPDIAVFEIDFFRLGDSLQLTLRGTADQVIVNNFFTDAGLDAIVFDDGTSFTAATVPWTTAPANWFEYRRGDGHVTEDINDPTGAIADGLRFGSNVDPATVRITANADGDLVISFLDPDGARNSRDSFRIRNGAQDAVAALDSIEFEADSTIDWNRDDILAMARTPTGAGDYLFGTAAGETIQGLAGDDAVHAGDGNDTLEGGLGRDVLYGEGGDDFLQGGKGADVLNGGTGSDTIRIGRGDGDDEIVEVDSDLSSIDRIEFGPGISPDDVRVLTTTEYLALMVYDPVTGSVISQARVRNYFTAGYADRTIDEIRFVDAPGIVWQRPQIMLAALQGGAHQDVLVGQDTHDVIRGMGGNDWIGGGLGNDDLDGGAGDDSLTGGGGGDTYRFGRGGGTDTIFESGGTDRILLAAGVTPSDVQIYRQSAFGNGELILVIDGSEHQLKVSDAYNVSGNTGIESIEFADGTVWNAAEIVTRTINRMGTQNVQTGTAAGDAYVVDNVNDGINEPFEGGVDTVQASVSYVLPANIENLTLTGLINLNGSGNALANNIVGNGGRNRLDGGAGVDTLAGGAGDDTYVVDDSGGSSFSDGWADGSQDVVVENAGAGFDTVVVTSYSATLAANVERLEAQAFTGNFSTFPSGADRRRRFVGNELDNVIDASALLPGSFNSYGTYLDGGLGADVMIGGDASQTYVVDNAGDLVVERGITIFGNQTSHDVVITGLNYTLTDNVEELVLVGSAAVTGTGNDLNNGMDGSQNSAANVLAGGDGDDTYRLGAGDTVIEGAGAGTDTVFILGPQGTYSTSDHVGVEIFELDNASASSNVIGDAANNRIIGNGGANVLEGGGGNDVLQDSRIRATGWSGQDSDVLLGGDGDDRLTTWYGFDTLDGGAGNDLLEDASNELSMTVTTYVFGRNYGHDTIVASRSSRASSQVDLGAGIATSDVTLTRDGRDLLLAIDGDTGSLRVLSFFAATTGYAVSPGVVSSIRFSDGTAWDRNRIVAPIRRADGAAPTSQNDVLLGSSIDDSIDALAGDDFLYGEGGNDTLSGSDGFDAIWGGAGSDTLSGGTGSDNLAGEAGNDELTGGAGMDTLRGGTGADSYRFGAGWGQDIINDSDGLPEDLSIDEIVFEAGINPADIQVRFGFSFPFQPDLLLYIAGTSEQITVRNHFGGEAGFSYSDHIEQIRFADGTIWNATEIRNRASQLVGTEGNDFLQAAGSFDSVLTGLGGDDRLVGGSGNDVLNGGSGIDNMEGRSGNDTFEVDVAGDTVLEEADGGTDLIRSSITWTLATNVEHLTLLGTGAINGIGNVNPNTITGNAGNNTLNGMGGADNLIGGAGSDIYVVDNAGDSITENAGEGTDTVQSSLNHVLSANFENLTLTGSAINATGNDGVNILVGNASANLIDGGAGADDMAGGQGNDTFVVDNAGDIVRESSGQGTDTILSSVTLTTLAANVEHVTLTGAANINAVGGSGNNTLTGNGGNNVLDGGAGTDTLIGGLGDDTYLVNSTTDTITELAGGGTDTVSSSVSFTINTTPLANVENITLTGTTANTTATGNALANVLTGTSVVNTLTGNDGNDTLNGLGGNDILTGGNGNDTLDGGTGNDGMTGGAGDDTFFVDSLTDTVTEASGGGTDTIRTTVQLTAWAANVENMTLLGTGNLNTPTSSTSSANNVITGNSGSNSLNGGAGNDTLNGAGGTDSLIGGTGADVYQYSAGGGTDTIDNVSSDSLVDRLQFLDLASDQIVFSRTGNNLVMTRVGVASDKVTVTNWFSASGNRLDFVNFTNVEKTATQIDALVNGGGGSFPLGMAQAVAMRIAPESEIGGDFDAWRAWDGSEIRASRGEGTDRDGSAIVQATIGANESSGALANWPPTESFTLGAKAAAEDEQYRRWQPIKSFPRDPTSVGVDRMIDAMISFGAERNTDSRLHAESSQLGAPPIAATGNNPEARGREHYWSEPQ